MLGISKIIRAIAGKNVQYRVNIPKKIASKLNLTGKEEILWKIEGDKITVEVLRDE